MPVHEPPKAEHLKPVAESRRSELTKLSATATKVGHDLSRFVLSKGGGPTVVKAYDRLLKGERPTNSREEMKMHTLRELADRAGEYSLDLNTYWSHVVRFANDLYSLGKGFPKAAELRELNDAISTVNHNLKEQLTDFERATSPRERDYNVDEILESGRKVLETIDHAGPHLVAGIEEARGNNLAESSKVAAFRVSVLMGFSGLSEQIGKRMAELAAGRTPPAIEMLPQTKQLLERAVKDRPRQLIAEEASPAAELIKNKDAYTADSVVSMWVKQLELREKLGANPQDRTNLEAEQKTIGRRLELFNDFIDKARKPGGEGVRIEKARETLDKVASTLRADDIARKLDDPNLSASEHAELINLLTLRNDPLPSKLADAERAALEAKASKAAKDLLGSFEPAVKLAKTKQTRLQQYEKHLSDGKMAIGKDPAAYWSKVKKTFLNEAKAVSGKEVRDALEKTMDSGLGQQLDSWKKELGKIPLDPAKLQGLASNLVETIDAYAKQPEVALGRYPASSAVVDKVQAGLAAIRETVVTQLNGLFVKGVFN